MKPNFNQIMKQAQQLQSKLEQAQLDIKALMVEGVAGAGLVRIKMDGVHRIHAVKINEDLMKDEREVLEDLVAAAYNDAARKIEEMTKKIMEDVAGGAGGAGGLAGMQGMLGA
ncbi:MAG: YbaB/EbfC family nucleoid-associated protein [Gammaproteobacteria bacterium]|nr:YbaB/EbfC family nucleoid-associated protein [Gammaproteobacteria bacterium]